jgi:hypothetical protein
MHVHNPGMHMCVCCACTAAEAPVGEKHGQQQQQQQWQHRLIVLFVLLQNADDAKAMTVRFVLDHNQYRTGTRGQPVDWRSKHACVGVGCLGTCLCWCGGGQLCCSNRLCAHGLVASAVRLLMRV